MVVAMPLLVAAYVGLGRLPAKRAAAAQSAALVPIGALSAYAIVLFTS